MESDQECIRVDAQVFNRSKRRGRRETGITALRRLHGISPRDGEAQQRQHRPLNWPQFATSSAVDGKTGASPSGGFGQIQDVKERSIGERAPAAELALSY